MTDCWQALRRPGFLRTSWPWRSAGYLLGCGVSGLVLCGVLVVWVAVGGALAVAVVGLPLVVALPLAGLPFGAWERRLLRLMGGPRPADPHRVPEAPGLRAWLRVRYGEAATWREAGSALLSAFLLWPLDLLVVAGALVPLQLLAAPLRLAWDGEQVNVLKVWQLHEPGQAWAVAAVGAVLLPLAGYPLTLAAGARAALVRVLTGGQEGVGELVRSRARLVDAFEAERRRIERDLHDGAQQRLVALSMALGLARLDAPAGGPLAERLAAAHAEADGALAELRELVHGIHPRVLADRGLPDACADLADRSVLPVEVAVSVPGRLPAPVESAGYFAVAEALANAAKHSGASRVRVAGRWSGGALALEVSDDGRGGADASAGSGLTGLADRVAVVGGRLSVSSPPGGPTLLRVEIPCTLTPSPRSV
ncbi:sensor domain-containing protein [Streptomyces sp. TLI_171]|uniref:sensor histidine kinase n=1 Tax=Streptomyces sp. TLI_171 TaxID=1938859 RepID=UPI000C17903A|nr:sensor domain-containing protein [Streptomyces sp. TLI_171]RKE21640.1 signal transduction histidine kinase [Streptomyces sp. TLI_171]